MLPDNTDCGYANFQPYAHTYIDSWTSSKELLKKIREVQKLVSKNKTNEAMDKLDELIDELVETL